MTIMPK